MQELTELFPTDASSPAAWIDHLRHLAKGSGDRLEEASRHASACFPKDIRIAGFYARAAEYRGDWFEAERRWKDIRQRFPANRAALVRHANALARSGRAQEAERIAGEGLVLFAELAERKGASMLRPLMILRARVAAARQDWAEAEKRWAELAGHFPDDAEIRTGYREIMLARDLEEPEIGRGETAEEAAAHHDDRLAALMLHFESMGGRCEFGLVQRHFGAEPLGLFRWVALTPERLKRALATQLDGIGDAEWTTLKVSAAGEFSTMDARYGLSMHTFVRDTGQDRERLLVQLQRRMVFLRRKLLEDLGLGEKIFVYRGRVDADAEHMAETLEALRVYNPQNILLYVAMLPVGAAPVMPAWKAPGLLFAGVQDGRKQPAGTGWNIDYDAWVSVLNCAREMIAGASPEHPAAQFPA